jgi:sec-independent protein translocase protein TatA
MSVPGGWELLVILFIVLLLFGAKRLPDLAGSMGKSMREFRKASKDALAEDEADTRERDQSAGGSDRDVES